MIHSKQFYKDLPKINGYKWVIFDNGLHFFQKETKGGYYKTIRLTEEDISDIDQFRFMLEYDYSRPQEYKPAKRERK